jgi:hypothetical protein
MENKELEDAAKEIFKEEYICNGIDIAPAWREGFVTGAKWQAERMDYLIEALNAIESIIDNDNPSHEDIWRIANGAIEQFKKTKDEK